MKKGVALNVIGVIFLIFGIGAWVNYTLTFDLNKIFWMCYLSLIIMGIGALRKNAYVIMSQVYILALPLIIWDIDFIFRLFSGTPLFGITDYFFWGDFNFGKFIVLQHLFSVPLAIFAARNIGLERKDAWKVSLIQIALVYITVSSFVPKEHNINCIFTSCVNTSLGLPYPLIWFVVFFGMTLVSAFVINNYIFKEN